MPVFFFDTNDEERRYEDPHGVELSSAAIARIETAKLVHDLAQAGLMTGGQSRRILAVVRDASGTEIYRATATLRRRHSLH